MNWDYLILSFKNKGRDTREFIRFYEDSTQSDPHINAAKFWCINTNAKFTQFNKT